MTPKIFYRAGDMYMLKGGMGSIEGSFFQEGYAVKALSGGGRNTPASKLSWAQRRVRGITGGERKRLC